MDNEWTIERVILAPQKAVDKLNAADARERDLLEANNAYLQRAREAEAALNALPPVQPLTGSALADALDCFWNAGIGEAHQRRSAEAMDVATVMAVGIAAVANRLKGDI